MHSPTLLSLLAFFSTLSTTRLIHDVTPTGFGTLLQENNLLLATFTSRSFEPLDPFHDILKEAADAMRTPFVIIDCDELPELCSKYDVNAYPALRLFRKVKSDENKNEDAVEDKNEYRTEMTRYRGKKTKNAIRSFVAKHELPVITHITPSTLADFKKVDDIVIIAYLRPDQKALLEVFRSTAKKHQGDFVFGYSTDMAATDAEGLAMPAIACYKNTDGDYKVMNGHFKEEDIKTFLKTATKPVIFEFSERNMNMFMAPGKLSAYIFAAIEDDQIAVRHELAAIAKKFEQFVTFGVVADMVEYAPMAKNFGVSENALPALVIHAPMNDNIFVYHQGRKIQASTVEAMLMTILEAKAVSGQVFGEDAPEMEGTDGTGHDEL